MNCTHIHTEFFATSIYFFNPFNSASLIKEDVVLNRPAAAAAVSAAVTDLQSAWPSERSTHPPRYPPNSLRWLVSSRRSCTRLSSITPRPRRSLWMLCYVRLESTRGRYCRQTIASTHYESRGPSTPLHAKRCAGGGRDERLASSLLMVLPITSDRYLWKSSKASSAPDKPRRCAPYRLSSLCTSSKCGPLRSSCGDTPATARELSIKTLRRDNQRRAQQRWEYAAAVSAVLNDQVASITAEGEAMVHDSRLLHAVSRMVSGVRYR